VLGFPVVDVVAASWATGRLESGERLRASSSPFTSSSIDMLSPFRWIKPWLARELSIGQGLRPVLLAEVSSVVSLVGLVSSDSLSRGPGRRHGWLLSPQLPRAAMAARRTNVIRMIWLRINEWIFQGDGEGRSEWMVTSPMHSCTSRDASLSLYVFMLMTLWARPHFISPSPAFAKPLQGGRMSWWGCNSGGQGWIWLAVGTRGER